jgi:hypothetical protein
MPTLPRPSPETLQLLAAVKTRWIDPAAKVLRRVVPLLMIAYLAYAFTKLGWGRIWHSRPSSLLFYLLLPLCYFPPAIADFFVFRNLWGIENAPPLMILQRKQFLNTNMFEYSGEGYFYFWARRNLELPIGSVIHAIKDSSVLSAGAGLAILWIVVIVLGAVGGSTVGKFIADHLVAFVLIAAIPLLLSLGLLIGGQRVTVLSRKQMAETFGIHFVRGTIGFGLELAAWWISGALGSIAVCFSFVALRFFVGRLPLLPRKDLLFMDLVLATVGVLKLSAPKIAAVFAMMIASDQIMGILIVGIPWLLERGSIGDGLRRKHRTKT